MCVMKKIIILLSISLFVLFNNSVFAKTKKIKCEKPIYYFEEANKNELFDELDKITQAKKIKIKKFYPELGFISFDYKVKKEPETVALSLKQQSHDVYLFIDISKNNTDLEKMIYNALKKHSKKSFLLKDKQFCLDFTKDTASINRNRKTSIQESVAADDVYRIGLNRYIGYDKKTYFKDKVRNFKQNLKKKKAKSKKSNKKSPNSNL